MSVQLKEQQRSGLGGFLEGMSGAEKGQVFELRSARLTVGRSTDNDICVSAEGVSRVHALIVNSEGAWFIRDNNSKNGIYINGKFVKESWLESGDVVQLGTFIFRFNAGEKLQDAPDGNLPDIAQMGGPLDVGMQQEKTAAKSKKVAFNGNPRILVYLAVLVVVGGYFMMGSSPDATKGADGEQTFSSDGKLARDFKTADKPKQELGNKGAVPLGLEDPLLKKAEQEMAKLDWSNTSLREAEQFFRRGQREYLNHNYHRAIDSFQGALSLYGGHLLAERYLRKAVYEAEIEAKSQMATAVQYYESLQYQRAIFHFNEVIALMSHRPDEAIVKEAKGYVKQAELRLQAAELFP